MDGFLRHFDLYLCHCPRFLPLLPIFLESAQNGIESLFPRFVD